MEEGCLSAQLAFSCSPGLSAFRGTHGRLPSTVRWARRCQLAVRIYPTDRPTGQSNGDNASIEDPSSQICQADNQDLSSHPSAGPWHEVKFKQRARGMDNQEAPNKVWSCLSLTSLCLGSSFSCRSSDKLSELCEDSFQEVSSSSGSYKAATFSSQQEIPGENPISRAHCFHGQIAKRHECPYIYIGNTLIHTK